MYKSLVICCPTRKHGWHSRIPGSMTTCLMRRSAFWCWLGSDTVITDPVDNWKSREQPQHGNSLFNDDGIIAELVVSSCRTDNAKNLFEEEGEQYNRQPPVSKLYNRSWHPKCLPTLKTGSLELWTTIVTSCAMSYLSENLDNKLIALTTQERSPPFPSNILLTGTIKLLSAVTTS